MHNIINETMMTPEEVGLGKEQMQAECLGTSRKTVLSCPQHCCHRLRLTNQGKSRLFKIFKLKIFKF